MKTYNVAAAVEKMVSRGIPREMAEKFAQAEAVRREKAEAASWQRWPLHVREMINEPLRSLIDWTKYDRVEFLNTFRWQNREEWDRDHYPRGMAMYSTTWWRRSAESENGENIARGGERPVRVSFGTKVSGPPPLDLKGIVAIRHEWDGHGAVYRGASWWHWID